MKKGLLFFAVVAIFSSCSKTKDDGVVTTTTNLVANWNGNGVAGTGSMPTSFGWASSYTGAVWDVANSTTVGIVRYMDAAVASTPVHTYNGATYVGRELMYRWDGAYWTSILSKGPVTLAAGTNYTFTWKYEWWANGTLPTFNVAIGTSADGTANVANKDFIASATKNMLTDGTFTFTTTTAGSYYLIITQKGTTSADGAVIGMADLSLSAVK